jgi:exodeoxyribonuclease VII small subunit
MAAFEEKMARLETIIDALQSPDISLQNSVALYEEGSKLAKELYEELDAAQEKVKILINKYGKPELADFTPGGES